MIMMYYDWELGRVFHVFWFHIFKFYNHRVVGKEGCSGWEILFSGFGAPSVFAEQKFLKEFPHFAIDVQDGSMTWTLGHKMDKLPIAIIKSIINHLCRNVPSSQPQISTAMCMCESEILRHTWTLIC